VKKYERLEIEVAQWPEQLAVPGFDDAVFRCSDKPGVGLHIWRGDETVQDVPAPDGLSERGMQMCLNALGRWQAEHPDKKIELQPDGTYAEVSAAPGDGPAKR